jgi:hypothetical protein
MAHSTKFLIFTLRDDPEVLGHITGITNAYGILDSSKEIVDKDACQRTLDQKGPECVLLWRHYLPHPDR